MSNHPGLGGYHASLAASSIGGHCEEQGDEAIPWLLTELLFRSSDRGCL